MTSAAISPELLARAKQTPLTRPAVDELAAAPGLDVGAVRAALDAAEAHAATTLAFACIARGLPLDAGTVRLLLADLEWQDAFGPLAFAATESDGGAGSAGGAGSTGSAGALEALLGMLEDGRASFEREALALLLVADATRGTPPPPAALKHARKLCRRAIDTETSMLLGAAATRLADRELSALAAQDVKQASRSKKLIEEILEKARRPPLDVLGATSGPRVVAGYTVRKDTAVGRNDACPCGSGKKYKKCCALKEETAVVSAPRIEPAALHPEQVAALRPAELAKLDLSQVGTKAWGAAFQRALTLREWDMAERMIDASAKSPELAKSLLDLQLLMLHTATKARARDVAERVFERLPPEEAAFEELAMAFLREEPDLLARIERAAQEALHDETNGAAAVELAYTVLQHSPALGILVARGAMHEGRVNDCQTLLDEMEDARDRLLLPAIEPWWDFYDSMIDAADDRDERIAKTAAQEKLARDLRKARDEKRRATAELTKMRERLEELDARAAEPEARPATAKKASPAPAAAAPPPAMSPELEEERRRLRTKVAELKRIVEEGQEERRELRKRIMEAAEAAEAEAEPESDDADDASDDDGDDDGDDAGEPRGVLVPRFTDRASKALRELEPVADTVLTVIAGLAAGRPNAWSGTKQLKKVRGVLSARAGIHHRILFRIDDGSLEVVDVIPRKELEVTVARLAAAR